MLKCSITMVFTFPLPSWHKFPVVWQRYVSMETMWKNTGGFVYDWLIAMLLVRSALVEEDGAEVFHHYFVHLSCSFLSEFQNNNVTVYPFPYHIFMPLANVWFICLRIFSKPKSKFPWTLYPLIRPPRRLLALARGRILIPGFIRSPPTLAVYDFAHSLPLGGAK